MKTILIIIVFVFSITTIYSQEKIQYKSKYINAIDYKAISGNIEYKNSSIIFSDKTDTVYVTILDKHMLIDFGRKLVNNEITIAPCSVILNKELYNCLIISSFDPIGLSITISIINIDNKDKILCTYKL